MTHILRANKQAKSNDLLIMLQFYFYLLIYWTAIS